MSKYVKIASVLFDQEYLRNQPGAREHVLRETSNKLDSLKGYGLNLVVLSEGIEAIAQKPEDAEKITNPGSLLKIYMEFAKTEKCYVAGSAKLLENGNLYNSVIFISPSGKIIGVYHKTNLTISELEAGLVPGNGAICIDTDIGRLGGIICFDLNFENIRKQYVELKPDIIVFPSMHHGGIMQGIWAYECRAFLISALPFIGGGIRDPFGIPLSLTDCHKSVAIARINLDRVMVHLDHNYDKFADIEKKYGEEVCINIPPDIGSALIYSQTEKRTASDIAKEYELELLDNYFKRASTANIESRKRLKNSKPLQDNSL
jgi:hypothetical protein